MPRQKTASGKVTKAGYTRKTYKRKPKGEPTAEPTIKVKETEVAPTEVWDIGELGKTEEERKWFKPNPLISGRLSEKGYAYTVPVNEREKIIDEVARELTKEKEVIEDAEKLGWKSIDVAYNMLWHHLHGLANIREGAEEFAKIKEGTPAEETEKLRARARAILFKDRDYTLEQSPYASKPRGWMRLSTEERAEIMPERT